MFKLQPAKTNNGLRVADKWAIRNRGARYSVTHPTRTTLMAITFPTAAVLNIVRVGLLQIRNRASLGEARYCEIEADHLHNLPSVVREESRALLQDYYLRQRRDYLDRVDPDIAALYSAYWAEISLYLEDQNRTGKL
jgi:hypothetical protein